MNWCKHDWTEWEQHGSYYSECGVWEERYCKKCGKIQERDDHGIIELKGVKYVVNGK